MTDQQRDIAQELAETIKKLTILKYDQPDEFFNDQNGHSVALARAELDFELLMEAVVKQRGRELSAIGSSQRSSPKIVPKLFQVRVSLHDDNFEGLEPFENFLNNEKN